MTEAGQGLPPDPPDPWDPEKWFAQIAGVDLHRFILALPRRMMLQQMLQVSPSNRPSARLIYSNLQKVVPITASAKQALMKFPETCTTVIGEVLSRDASKFAARLNTDVKHS
jgi:hypothetical protein